MRENGQLLLEPDAQLITIFVSGPFKISLPPCFSHVLCLSKTLIFHFFLSPVLTCLYLVCCLSPWNDKVKLTRYSHQLCKENIIISLTWLSILIKLGYLKDNPFRFCEDALISMSAEGSAYNRGLGRGI